MARVRFASGLTPKDFPYNKLSEFVGEGSHGLLLTISCTSAENQWADVMFEGYGQVCAVPTKLLEMAENIEPENSLYDAYFGDYPSDPFQYLYDEGVTTPYVPA